MKAVVVGTHKGIHESRFIRSFRQRGASAEFVSFDDLEAFSKIEINNGRPRSFGFVFGGPLHVSSPALNFLKEVPYIAASYAFDVLYEARLYRNAELGVSEMLEASRGLVADCEAVASAVKEEYKYTKPILVRPWGLETKRRHNLQNFSSLCTVNDGFCHGNTVVTVRNFTPIHRVMDVIYAFKIAIAKNPALRLVMAGDGPLRDPVSRLVSDLGLSERVTLLGALPEMDVVNLIASADLYVSASAVDGTSISLLQALECGVPVVLSNVGGNPEWAHRVAGADLFKVGDLKQLGSLIASRTGERRFDRSSVIEEFADWNGNANAIFDFCRSIGEQSVPNACRDH